MSKLMIAVFFGAGLGVVGSGTAQVYEPQTSSTPPYQNSSIAREAAFVKDKANAYPERVAGLSRQERMARAYDRNPGYADMRDAEYKVLIEECDERGGPGMNRCFDNVKVRYGKP